ncbi:MAG: sterol desaturase [Leptolyngbyaceae cyanobacterium SM1_1_3]|nr:sterol desaturase [Leptolyngbyaceae cyanobacterium SM1_1_3]NJN02835.1 sterol desaturase [Leptolyngbyaceae cyanobacterium RM1_1_2]NJO11607.1 sterol desaturase [Leptolyngbyaceae cyanobacterium SL_1_1]
MKIALSALLLLLLGDFVATFLYHVPEHVFGRFHTIVHHSPRRSFVCYAWLNRQPTALVFGFFGFFSYFLWVPLLWPLSAKGVLLGLCLAELHVIWRHQFSASYSTPAWMQRLCRLLCITTPERHWLHHQNANLAYGDIFTFYAVPAQHWLKLLRKLKKKLHYRLLA